MQGNPLPDMIKVYEFLDTNLRNAVMGQPFSYTPQMQKSVQDLVNNLINSNAQLEQNSDTVNYITGAANEMMSQRYQQSRNVQPNPNAPNNQHGGQRIPTGHHSLGNIFGK